MCKRALGYLEIHIFPILQLLYVLLSQRDNEFFRLEIIRTDKLFQRFKEFQLRLRAPVYVFDSFNSLLQLLVSFIQHFGILLFLLYEQLLLVLVDTLSHLCQILHKNSLNIEFLIDFALTLVIHHQLMPVTRLRIGNIHIGLQFFGHILWNLNHARFCVHELSLGDAGCKVETVRNVLIPFHKFVIQFLLLITSLIKLEKEDEVLLKLRHRKAKIQNFT